MERTRSKERQKERLEGEQTDARTRNQAIKRTQTPRIVYLSSGETQRTSKDKFTFKI
jgi:hypothetical protein